MPDEREKNASNSENEFRPMKLMQERENCSADDETNVTFSEEIGINFREPWCEIEAKNDTMVNVYRAFPMH